MIVRMAVAISGSRNDSAWPAPGDTLEVPDDEGQELIKLGLAVPAGHAPKPKPEPPPAPKVEAKVQPEPEVGDDEDEDDSGPPRVPGGPPRPAASKQEWIDWAVSQGAEWIFATNSTKQQLMETYGQRP